MLLLPVVLSLLPGTILQLLPSSPSSKGLSPPNSTFSSPYLPSLHPNSASLHLSPSFLPPSSPVSSSLYQSPFYLSPSLTPYSLLSLSHTHTLFFPPYPAFPITTTVVECQGARHQFWHFMAPPVPPFPPSPPNTTYSPTFFSTSHQAFIRIPFLISASFYSLAFPFFHFNSFSSILWIYKFQKNILDKGSLSKLLPHHVRNSVLLSRVITNTLR